MFNCSSLCRTPMAVQPVPAAFTAPHCREPSPVLSSIVAATIFADPATNPARADHSAAITALPLKPSTLLPSSRRAQPRPCPAPLPSPLPFMPRRRCCFLFRSAIAAASLCSCTNPICHAGAAIASPLLLLNPLSCSLHR